MNEKTARRVVKELKPLYRLSSAKQLLVFNALIALYTKKKLLIIFVKVFTLLKLFRASLELYQVITNNI